MKKAMVYTSTLPANLLQWLDKYAKEKKISKNALIEKALLKMKYEEERDAFREGFKRAAQDPEMLLMAEEGLDDYLDQLKRLGV